jgi:hypothetical protein
LAAAPAFADSLYSGPGPRPGPDILYAPAGNAPQLTNTGVWRATPILVSGASAYRDGEFLYQDYLYDDHGAQEQYDPGDPRNPGNVFSKPNGTYTYPSDPKYANDAADLVEFRVRPLSDATAFRVTLNTLKDPSLVAFSIAIGGTPGVSLSFPDGANVRAPADLFLTVHPSGSGMAADLVHAAVGAPVAGPAPTVSVDTTRRQIEVRVPHADWDPTGTVVRLAAGVGLWDKANGRYLLPQPAADATHPGGSGSAAAPAAFFNVAFRNDEQMPTIKDVFNTATGPSWWRDKEQGQQLAVGDITNLHADVDFTKLASGVDDDSAVPRTGPIDRILASHFETAQGADFGVVCLTSRGAGCPGQYQGQLQPYAIYVPKQPAPARGYGMTLLMHSLSTNYNQYLASRNQSEFGERGPGSIVITPEARGPDGGYQNIAAADVFEVWADVARRYKLDPDWTVTTGYSMGGIGTFTLAEEFPDLFARGQPTVGDSSDTNLVANLRNVPFLMWNVLTDELVPPPSYLPTAEKLDSLGYRYEIDVFTPAEHNTLAINDEFAPAAAFLGTATVDRNPPHVTFVRDPSLDRANLGYVNDHAYWLSGIKPRGSGQGTVDALSRGLGVGDPQPSDTGHGGGTLTGGTIPAIGFASQFKTWGPAPARPKQDVLDVNAQNVRTVTVNAPRARLSCAAKVNLKSDGATDVVLGGCEQALGLPSASRCVDTRKFSFRLHHPRRARIVAVEAFVNGKRVARRRGRNITRITLTRLPQRAFKVKIVATQSTGSQLISTRTYRGCAKTRPRTRRNHHRTSRR